MQKPHKKPQLLSGYGLVFVMPLLALAANKAMALLGFKSGVFHSHYFAVIVVCWFASLRASLLSVVWSLLVVVLWVFRLQGMPTGEELYRMTMFGVISTGIVLLANRTRRVREVADKADRENVRRTTILDNVGEYAIVMFDPDGRIIHWNHGAQVMKGYTTDEIIGRHFSTLFADNEQGRSAAAAVFDHAKAHGRYAGEQLHRRKDGTTFLAWVVMNAIYEGGVVTGFVEIVSDVTERRRKENDLRYQLQLNATITNTALDPMFMTDHTGRITYLNPAAQRTLGCENGEFLGKFFPDAVRCASATLGRAILDGAEVRDCETVVCTRDGKPIPVLCSSGPIMHDGRVMGAVLVVTDITEQRRAKEALQDEVRITATLNEIGKMLTSELENERLIQMVIDKTTEATGARWGTYFYFPDEDQPDEGALLYAFSGPDRETFTKLGTVSITKLFEPTFVEGKTVRCEDVLGDPRYGHNRHAGYPVGHVPIRSYLATPVTSRSGKILGALLFGHDDPGMFSARDEELLEGIASQASIALDNAKLVKSLRASESSYRFLAESIPQMMWTALPNGYVDYVNRCFFDYTGINPAVLMEKRANDSWLKRLHPDDVPNTVERWHKCLSTGCDYEVEYRFRRHDGEYHWFLVRGRPMRDDSGEIVRWFGTCTDIHEQKTTAMALTVAKEEAEAASKAKDNFIAVLSHELRTPLTPVIASIDGLIRFGKWPRELTDELWMLRRNVELEISLINDLLEVTRITRGKLMLNRQDVYAHDLVRNAVRVCDEDIKKKHIDVKVELEAKRCHIWGDPARLQQVLWNLLKNAVRFTENDGKIVIRTENDGDELRISVTDNGWGIDKEHVATLFRPFEQGDHAAGSISKGGLGLGLSIAKGLVEMHGGRIAAYSEGRYRGATFAINIPTFDPTQKPPVEKPVEETPVEPRTGAHILLVEDHDDTRDSMAKLLGYAGHEVETAANVAEALRMIRAKPFDLLISDIGLPDGTGHELMRKLRAEENRLRGIALTGFGQDDDVKRSRDVGFSYHVTKPVNLDVLSNVINQTLAEEPA